MRCECEVSTCVLPAREVRYVHALGRLRVDGRLAVVEGVEEEGIGWRRDSAGGGDGGDGGGLDENSAMVSSACIGGGGDIASKSIHTASPKPGAIP